MHDVMTATPSSLVSHMVESTREAGINIIKDLVNQIKAEGMILAECEFSTKVKYYKRKGML